MTEDAPSPPRRRRSPWLVASAFVAVVVVLVIAATVAWLSSPSATQYAVERASAATAGRLTIEGAQGTLLGPLRATRVRWRDGGTDIVAEDVTIDYQPAALAGGRLVVRELRASRAAVTLADTGAERAAMPDDLALPIDVDIARIVVDSVEWDGAGHRTTLSNISLAYAADRREHRIRGLRVHAPGATLTGTATLGTTKPFPTSGAASLVLAQPHPEGRVDAKFDGNLQSLELALRSDLAQVVAEGRARIAPFASQPFIEGRGTARDIDLSRFDPAWPATRVTVAFEALPAPDGYTGQLTLENGAPGPIDAKRLPVASVSTSYALAGRTFRLARASAAIDGGGTLQGGGTLDLDTMRSRWKLDVRGVDLKHLHTALVATALSGAIDADVDGDTQHVVGDVSQKDLRLAFDARYDGKKLDVARVLAQSAGGALEGKGQFQVAGAQPFAFDGRATRFDPARFGKFPAGSLDATLSVKGTFDPVISADADVVIARGSRFAGLPTQGHVRGRFTPSTVRALDADIAFGANRVRGTGNYGRPGDRLQLALAAKRLGELTALLPATVPRPVSGVLDATLAVDERARGASLTFDARATQLAVGNDWRAQRLAVAGTALHDAPLSTPRIEALRDVDVKVSVAEASTPRGALARATATLEGSANAHRLALDARTGERTIDVALAGSLAEPLDRPVWRGRIERLATRGVPVLSEVRLAGPVPLELAQERVVLGAFRLDGAATVESDGVDYRNGALVTRGRFSGLAAAPLLTQAGVDPGFPIDLVIGGAWDVSSTPDWRGSFTVRRERGDVRVDDPGGDDKATLALGIETLALDAKLDGRRVTGHAELHAKVGGNALADFDVVAPAGAAHPFNEASSVRASVRAHVPALGTLQPWIGTLARVQGQAIADMTVAGTVAKPVLSGQLVAYDLRYDMPQYGVSLREGRLRVASHAEGLRLEELEFRSGDGRFVASGVLGLPRERGAPAPPSKIEWRAENFRALNRPEMRLVVDGEGTLGYEAKRLLLRGRIAADEGYLEYRPRDDTKLADDIVVVGRPRPGGPRGEASLATTPLDLDLTVELGRELRFVGEGFDARLAGKVQLTSRGGGPILAKGTIRAVRGTYTAYGQRLDIDRGRLIFDGPIANPSLDIVALRKNQAVEAGVEISGNVRAPIVRLTSNPPVPDSEKLAWLITGGPAGSTTARESAALSAATAALLGRGGRPMSQRFAERVGLDDISVVRREGASASDPVGAQVVTLGKRITDRLYVAYEQGLSAASNAIRIEYVVSRFLSVSAFAGAESGLAFNFRRSWP